MRNVVGDIVFLVGLLSAAVGAYRIGTNEMMVCIGLVMAAIAFILALRRKR